MRVNVPHDAVDRHPSAAQARSERRSPTHSPQGALNSDTIIALQRAAGNEVTAQLIGTLTVQRAPDAHLTRENWAIFHAHFAEHFAEVVQKLADPNKLSEEQLFQKVHTTFLGKQTVYTEKVIYDRRFEETVRDRAWQSVYGRWRDSETSGKPMDKSKDVHLYRKMVRAEANTFIFGRADVGAKPVAPGAGIAKSMEHFQSDQYRKYFTTSLVHTSTFQNENSADPENEVVLELTLSAADYWKFFKTYARPNQKAGVLDEKTSAIVNQERLRVGPGANHTEAQHVDNVYLGKEHHNIGIGNGNVADFAKLATKIREVPTGEIADAVARARADMVALVTA